MSMDHELLINRLRAATEDDVIRSFAGAYIKLAEHSPRELLEFFSRMIDVLIGEVEH